MGVWWLGGWWMALDSLMLGFRWLFLGDFWFGGWKKICVWVLQFANAGRHGFTKQWSHNAPDKAKIKERKECIPKQDHLRKRTSVTSSQIEYHPNHPPIFFLQIQNTDFRKIVPQIHRERRIAKWEKKRKEKKPKEKIEEPTECKKRVHLSFKLPNIDTLYNPLKQKAKTSIIPPKCVECFLFCTP